MKFLFVTIGIVFFSNTAFATDYYAALWNNSTQQISTGRNSDENVVVGYSIGGWPSQSRGVTTVTNLSDLIKVIDADPAKPHTLKIWRGTFDDIGDFIVLDHPNNYSMTVEGQGKSTILDGNRIIRDFSVMLNGVSGVTLRGLKIIGGAEGIKVSDSPVSESSRNPRGITIDNVTLENQDAYGIRFGCTQQSISGFTLKNSTITDNNYDSEGIRLITYSNCNINNIKIQNNVWKGGMNAINFFSQESHAGANNASPYNVLIEDNTVMNTANFGIGLQSGLKAGTGTTSYIRNNYLENIGRPTSPRVNALQLNWSHDLIVEKNTINRVNTSDPDGHGIIVDWAWRNSNYMSDGVIVRRNIVYGMQSLNCENSYAAGVNVYKARNTVVHHNVSYDNCVGYKLSQRDSTGTVFYNNTAYRNILSNVRVDLGAPASVWKNNIFDGAGITPYGVLCANPATVTPTLSNNIYYNHTRSDARDYPRSANIPLGAGSQTTDPQLKNFFVLPPNSPAVDAGNNAVLTNLASATSVNGVKILPNMAMDVGAFEYSTDPQNLGDGFVLGSMDLSGRDFETVTLANRVMDPVVIAGPPTAFAAEPGVVAIHNVTPIGFDVKFKEWDYLNDKHPTEKASYMVWQEGRYQMADGTVVDVGRFNTEGRLGTFSVHFSRPLAGPPTALFMTPQTTNGSDTISLRTLSQSNSGFEVMIQEQEANQDGEHANEIIGYVAIYKPSNTGTIQTTDRQYGFNLGVQQISDKTQYIAPNLMLRLEEERSADYETEHAPEDVMLMKIDGHVFAQVASGIGMDTVAPRLVIERRGVGPGLQLLGTRMVGTRAVPLNYNTIYEYPIIVASAASSNGTQPGMPTIHDIGPTGFKAAFVEWDYLDNLHTEEEVDFMIAEAGRTMQWDGTMIEAGTFDINGIHEYKNVEFQKPFARVPYVFLMLQGNDGQDLGIVRVKNITRVGFQAALYEKESMLRGTHGFETVGYIAVMPAGNTVNLDGPSGLLAANLARMSFTHEPRPVSGGKSLYLQEEQSFDTELSHTNETLNLLYYGASIFAQQTTVNGVDPAVPRLR